MFKKSITFTDFRGEEKTKDYYFNLTKTELAKYQTSTYQGMEDKLLGIAKEKNVPETSNLFDKFILASYGEISDDGVSFIKEKDGHKLAEDFMQTAAYDELYQELGSDADAALEFAAGVLPREFRSEINDMRERLKTNSAEKVIADAQNKILNADTSDKSQA